MRTLTIAYITCRREPHLNWFFDSLHNQCWKHCEFFKERLNVIVVDAHAKTRGISQTARFPDEMNIRHVAPKPCVWQGPYRLTSVDFFSAANARNTAIALCETDFICFVDDCSVLMPGWLECVLDAISRDNQVTCGHFNKVRDLLVEQGSVKAFRPHPDGSDWRMKGRGNMDAFYCPSEFAFGCSLIAPVEALLAVNGYPEFLCDGMGYEDVVMGKVLENNGIKFLMVPSMSTWECETSHHTDTPFLRIDPGLSPNDKSHLVLKTAPHLKAFSQDFGFGRNEDGLRKLKDTVSKGWPIPTAPTDEWFTGIALKDFHTYGK